MNVIRWLCGFFSNKSDQSMTRALALLLGVGALMLIVAVYRVATRQSLEGAALTITAICGGLATVVTGIFGALAKRTKLTDHPPGVSP
jgi:hypothetical protein